MDLAYRFFGIEHRRILSYFRDLTSTKASKVINLETPPAQRTDDEESLDVWGFRDTHFDFSENGHVIIRGSRYELSGKELPRFLPWVREILECDVNPRNVNPPRYPRSEEHTSELQSLRHLVCRLLLE